MSPFTVAIAGCGQIAQVHISALKELSQARIVAVADRDEQRARSASAAADGAHIYGDLADLIAAERPNVVHITTPPGTHAPLAIQAMEAGAHVLVEKPMALSREEADRMIAAARANQVTLSTNHNYLYNPSIQRARRLVASGAVGKVVYVDSYYGLSGEGDSYALTGGRFHWAWRLPGGAFTNFLPHLVYLQLAFMGEVDSVAGLALAHDASGNSPPTDMTVLLEGPQVTGVMAISMRARPYAKFVNIYGTRATIHADLVREVTTVHPTHRLPGMLSKAAYSLEEAGQLTWGTISTTLQVATRRLKPYAGLRNFVREFYLSLEEGREPPASGEDGRRMVTVLEKIWARAREQGLILEAPPLPVATSARPAPDPRTEAESAVAVTNLGRVLVTGGTGFLGHRLIAALSRAGVDVVGLVRDKRLAAPELHRQATLIEGDVRNRASLEHAMKGVDIVIHCAAVTSNNTPWSVHEEVNIRGSESVFQAALAAGVRQVIHVSSVVVYGLDPRRNGTPVGESTALANNTDGWAYYLRSKLESDRLALNYHHELGLPVTVVRLGILYGPGAARSAGRGLAQVGPLRLIVGSGANILPYTFVDNAVDAILLAAIQPAAIGQAYNIVDEPQVTMRECALESAHATGESLRLIPLPALVLSGLARYLERQSQRKASSVPPKLTRYVVRSAVRNIRYDTTKAREELNWKPSVSLQEGLRRSLQDG